MVAAHAQSFDARRESGSTWRSPNAGATCRMPISPDVTAPMAPIGTATTSRAVGAEPAWLTESLRSVKQELSLYLATALAFGVRPRATAAAWANGRFRALNPIAYLLNGVAVLGPWQTIWRHLLHLPDLPFWRDILNGVLPFLGVLVYGSLHHLVFRLFGSKRRITSTWAISIYGTSGLPTIITILLTPAFLHARALGERLTKATSLHSQDLMSGDWLRLWQYAALGGLVSIVTFVIQVSAFSGLHGMTRRRSFGVLVLSGFLAALLVTVGVLGAGALIQLLHAEPFLARLRG